MSSLIRNLGLRHLLYISLIGLQLLVITGLVTVLPEVLRAPLVVAALLIVPGVFSATLVYGQQKITQWQALGLGAGLGLAEALLWGRLLLAVGAPVETLGLVVLITSLMKVIWLWRQPLAWLPTRVEHPQRLIVPFIVIGAVALTLLQLNLSYPFSTANTIRINDKWSYLAVMEQFIANPGNLNLRPDAITFGSNTRLSWNSWLYFQASVSQLSGLHPMLLIFNFVRPIVFILLVISLTSLGYELFGNLWMAVAAAALQLLFLIGLSFNGFWVWMRLEEDKYFAFTTVAALAMVFLLRTIYYRRWNDLIGLAGMSMSIALIHPMGLPGLLLIGTPVLLIEGFTQRAAGFTVRWLALAFTAMVVFIGITILDQVQVNATEYVQEFIAETGSLPAFSLENVRPLLSNSGRIVLLILIPLLLLSIRDKTARILFLMTISCVSVLTIPIITVIVSRLSTSVGIERYNWLIPYGFIAAWAIVRVSQRWAINPFPLTTALCMGVIVLSGWEQWWEQGSRWLFWQEVPQPSLVLSAAEWTSFNETADAVASKRIITPVEYGLVAPILWPGANLLIFNSPIHAPQAWPYLVALYQATDKGTVWSALDFLQPELMWVPHTAPVYQVMKADPANFDALYSNEGASLFVTGGVASRRMDDPMVLLPDQDTLQPGTCTELRWQAHDFHSLSLDDAPVEPVGSHTICPTSDQRFILLGTRADGRVVQQSAHVFVSVAYAYTLQYHADRYVIPTGECVTIRWQAEEIDSVYFQEEGTVGLSSQAVCPTQDTVYTLRVLLRNQDTVRKLITIYVRDE